MNADTPKLEPSPIEKIERAKVKKSDYRKNFCKWFWELTVEERIKAISIVNIDFVNIFESMKNRYDTNCKTYFRFNKICMPFSNEFKFCDTFHNDEELKDERKMTESLLFRELRFLTINENNDTITFTNSFLDNRNQFEYEMLYFTHNKFLEERCW